MIGRAFRARRGIGVILTLVLGLVFLIGCSAFAFLTMSSRALGQAVWGAGGAMAEVAAESSAEEVFFRLQKDVADPDSPVFAKVRLALLQGQPPTLDLSNDYRTSELYADLLATSTDAALFRRIELEPPRVLLDVLPPGPRGASQRVRVEASARVAFSPASRRTCRVERAIGITPVFVPKPFDQCTFAILEYDFLKTLPAIARETRRLVEKYNEVLPYMSGWAALAEGNTCALPACVEDACCGCIVEKGCCGCPAAHCHRLPRRYEASTWFFDRPQTKFAAALYLCERYKFPLEWVTFPKDAVHERLVVPEDSVIYAVESGVDLKEFEHEKKLADLYYPRIKALKQEAAHFNRLISEKQGATLCTDDHRDWHQQLMRRGRNMRRELGAAVEVLNQVLRHVRDHTRPGLTTGSAMAAIDGARGRLRPLAAHVGSGRELDSLLTDRPAMSGHVAYFGGSAVRLELPAFQGKAVLSTGPEAGGFLVGVVRLADPDQDRLVLWSSSLTLSAGPIEASLFSSERVSFPAPPVIRGNLVMRHLTHRAQRSHDEDLRGTIEYDERVFAGPLATAPSELESLSLGHYAIGIGPAVLTRGLAR